jgi:hypothetical protein
MELSPYLKDIWLMYGISSYKVHEDQEHMDDRRDGRRRDEYSNEIPRVGAFE